MQSNLENVRNTKQRKHLLALLSSTKSHPNAFWLYEKMLPAFPHLSLSTVYRNLGILESQGLLQRLSCGGTFDRYDADTSTHSHFYCKKCSHVYDIDGSAFEEQLLADADCGQHHAQGCHITFYGICEECKQHNNQE